MLRLLAFIAAAAVVEGYSWKTFTKRPKFQDRLIYHPESGAKLREWAGCNLTGTWTGLVKDSWVDEYLMTSTDLHNFTVMAVTKGSWSSGAGTINADGSVVMELDKSSTQGITLHGKITNCTSIAWDNGSRWKRQNQIKKVHVVFMNHLDIGYAIHTPEGNPIGFMANVINSYTSEYFPAAAALANGMRALGGTDRFIYTTHPWLVSLYIDCPPDFVLANGTKLFCPTEAELAGFKKAVANGDIVWHDGPFNLQSEAVSPLLFELGLRLSDDINTKLGVPQRTNKVYNLRDVPGSTRSVVSLLAKNGFAAITVGQNPGTPTPAGWYPHKMWRWQDTDGSTILGLNHAGGYPSDPGPDAEHCEGLCRNDCMMADGFDEALCFAFRTDNSGPPESLQDVVNVFSILNVEFPGAEVRASTLSSFVDVALKNMDKFELITKEIGDTWIQGVQSDPKKVAHFRAYCREMEKCLAAKSCVRTDFRIINSTRLALTLPEHTWGLPGVGDTAHWSNKDFTPYRLTDPGFANLENGWEEHRKWLDYALEALQDHPVRAAIEREIAEADFEGAPSIAGLKLVDPNTTIKYGDTAFRFNGAGSMDYLSLNGTVLASTNSSLLQFVYSSYTDTDFDEMAKSYQGPTGDGCGYNKPNMDKAGRPTRADYTPELKGLWVSADQRTSVLQLVMPSMAVEYYGAAPVTWVNVTVSGSTLEVDVRFMNKTMTRLAEAMHINFSPVNSAGWKWAVDKMGTMVDPHDTIDNGNPKQHGIWTGVRLGPLRVDSTDVSVASPITATSPATPFLKDLSPITEPITGMGFNVWNNIWNTNYAFYYPYLRTHPEDANIRARFRVYLE
eukprot:Hpha_TRINITY_DN16121_c1_g8::TRINITY_DN16121_c1_g8_i1::g.4195::m.4195